MKFQVGDFITSMATPGYIYVIRQCLENEYTLEVLKHKTFPVGHTSNIEIERVDNNARLLTKLEKALK